MSPHYWIEIRSVPRLLLFAACVSALILFWYVLPEEAKRVIAAPRHRGLWGTVGVMSVGWVAGWFLLLFVRAEDLGVATPFNYEALNRVIAVLLIASAIATAGYLSLSFFDQETPKQSARLGVK